ncbi:MAG: fluoride efflux transporter CrcB [Flavobacteriales bacterium]
MKEIITVFIGGGAGSVLRYGLSLWWEKTGTLFPFGTLVANLLAAALIAILYALQLKQSHPLWWYLLAVGICGGLSTFSTFSLETFQLMKSGHLQYAMLNVVLSLAGSVGIVWMLGRR